MGNAMDQMESILNNALVSVAIGAFLVDWGLSRWQKRSLSKNSFLAIFLISLGARFVLKSLS